MANTVIALKKSAIPGSTPSSLANGELAINFADGKLFYKAANGSITELSGAGFYYNTVNVGGTFLIADVKDDILSVGAGDNIILTANALSDSFTISANLEVANVYTRSVGTAGNNYTITVGAASNSWTNTTVTPAFVQANTAYNAANDAFAAAVALAIALG